MSLPSCPVRACGRPLQRCDGRLECAARHGFDIARAGHVNLLQPQDRRSGSPGDADEAVAARSRALTAGAGEHLVSAILEIVDALAPAGPLAVLDVGCGDGFMLRRLGEHREIDAHGVDLSATAARAAARACPGGMVVVANADRGLPWPDATFDVALSVTARRPGEELRRVLKPGGLLIVAVPAEDDLLELREAVLGEGRQRDRLASVRAELGPELVEACHRLVSARPWMDPAGMRDLLASTYRGARRSQQGRMASLEPGHVTLSHHVLAFRPRPRALAP